MGSFERSLSESSRRQQRSSRYATHVKFAEVPEPSRMPLAREKSSCCVNNCPNSIQNWGGCSEFAKEPEVFRRRWHIASKLIELSERRGELWDPQRLLIHHFKVFEQMKTLSPICLVNCRAIYHLKVLHRPLLASAADKDANLRSVSRSLCEAAISTILAIMTI